MVVLLKQERRQQSADTHASGLEAARSALMSVPSTDPVTEHELDVLELLGARLSNNEIAGCLMISEPTVKRHAANAYRKLRVSHRRLAIPRPTTLGALPRRTSRRGVVPGPRVVPILGALGRHS